MLLPNQNTVIGRDLRRFILEETERKWYSDYEIGCSKYAKVKWDKVWLQIDSKTEEQVGYVITIHRYFLEEPKVYILDLNLLLCEELDDLCSAF